MENREKRVCIRCLLRDMAEADKAMIEKYKAAIKKSDQVPDEEYERNYRKTENGISFKIPACSIICIRLKK